jgi:hypothetical protein
MVSASKTDASWSMSSAVAQSRNGVLADTEAASVVVTTQKLLPLVLLVTVLPLVLEASAAVEADLAAIEVASEEVSVVEEEVVIEVDSAADLAGVIEVGMVVELADLESATATDSQRALHPVLVVLPEEEAAAMAAVVMAAFRALAIMVATATLAEAQDTATDRRHATTMAVAAAATANPSEVENVVAVATAIVIGNAITTASAPTTETVATTNHASKEGTERFLGLLHTFSMHALGRSILSHASKIDGKLTTTCAKRR